MFLIGTSVFYARTCRARNRYRDTKYASVFFEILSIVGKLVDIAKKDLIRWDFKGFEIESRKRLQEDAGI